MESHTANFGRVLPKFIFALRMEAVCSSEAVVPTHTVITQDITIVIVETERILNYICWQYI